MKTLPKYDPRLTYDANYDASPEPVQLEVPPVPGDWHFCGLPVDAPLGVAAGPLLNGKWCLYYASLGFDVVTYKTVRSIHRECYAMPNLQPVDCGQLDGGETTVSARDQMAGSWAVSFGMPSRTPDVWRRDIEQTRNKLPRGKLLSVSVVGSVQEGWTIDDLARDYANCAQWAAESGADTVEANFSCPNVSTCDGQLYQQPEDAARVAEQIREQIGNVPLILKIGRLTAESQAAALLSAVTPHIDAVALTNSIAAHVEANGRLLFDGERRGICGRATRTASVSQTRLFSRLIGGGSTHLIGVGGAETCDDVRQYLAAGAHSVHMATAPMVHPEIAIEIRRRWATLME